MRSTAVIFIRAVDRRDATNASARPRRSPAGPRTDGSATVAS